MSSGHSSNAENSDAAATKRTSKREHSRAEKLSHQAEIESRTNAGESCKQIADALQANGHQISDKTVARWRVQWATANALRVPPRASLCVLRASTRGAMSHVTGLAAQSKTSPKSGSRSSRAT
ncbi:hypothetical protein LTR48_008261, partial [Friedmanniomyces endolithicus]